MIIVLNYATTTEQIDRILLKISRSGLEPFYLEHYGKKMITVIGNSKACNIDDYQNLPGVESVSLITTPFKLASREFKQSKSIIKVRDVEFGGAAKPVIAGPCAIEGYEQFREAAMAVKKAGAVMLRGGAYKPRTSPYSFQGLEEEGLSILLAVSREFNMPTVSEVTDPRNIEVVSRHVDMLQVGARNMQNFVLLKEVAKTNQPILLKRGASATIEEWLMAAEYIMAGGNPNVLLCERGIRTFETYTRNTLDLSAVPLVQHLSHLPVIVDPSHGTGSWRLVSPMARAAVGAGADGLIIEVHTCPEEAASDGPQSLTPHNFSKLMKDIAAISAVITDN
ncbi:3-deoxy-7-phosphoheptulonate synthase [Sporomusaceae bacterium FL31]|nr:3-deoxy-7-phosphoheptulonate synthase [Sporomusaceae bacterium FL31]GCE33356.1 3-deoxy-7-phosphoheptulonate synthase [Sporomusaceae bacterium]